MKIFGKVESIDLMVSVRMFSRLNVDSDNI